MSVMSASAQPRTPDGRFRTTEAAEPAGVALTAPADPAVIRARGAAEEFLEFNGLLDIVDHSVTAEEYGTVELHRMAEADIARGNCWAVTNEVIELGAGELGAEWVDELTISGRGQHVAVLAGYPEG